MGIRAACIALILAGPASAQEGEAPGWLSETILAPNGNIATTATPQDITVMPIGAVRLDAVGLLTPLQTGLPADLWVPSASTTLARLFRAQPYEGLPAIQSLTEMLALAEVNPPLDATPESTLFLARLDLLLERGAIDPARALMERAGPTTPQVFRRWFDVSLLAGQPDRACAAMRANPDIAPSFPARIFCLARGGDWSAAALTLGTGEALGFIAVEDGDLIARFLDPELFAGEPALPPDPAPTPLHYEMRAAIGERQGAATLPLAFSQSDLAPTAGWRAQLDAAERLARSGAITPDQWQIIYTSRVPSASGGIWDRVDALQAFDVALLARDPDAVVRLLPEVWAAMQEARLEVPFAEVYAERLMRLPLTGEAALLARRVALLSDIYERTAQLNVPQSDEERFLFAIARGLSPEINLRGAIPRMLTIAFASIDLPDRYRRLIEDQRIGEALLQAALVLSSGDGDLDDMGDALQLLRHLGLESTARRAALQLMILDRAA